MKRSMRSAVLLFLALGVASPASAIPFTLALDPGLSSLVPEAAPAESLTGTITVEVSSLPLVGASAFSLTDVSVTASGGSSITLDPTLATPALGVLQADGSFLIPTLFLRVDDGASVFDLAITDVAGALSVAGSVVTGLTTAFPLDTDVAMPGTGSVQITAVPEPATALALATALAALAARRLHPEISR